MLSVPFKKTDASIDLAGPLRRYLMKEFSKEEVDKYAQDLQALQHLRGTATQVDRPSDGAREALLRYSAQLEALEPVFPVSETEVRVGFKWGDAFNPNKKSTQSTLLFERTCVLYNMGAHESRSASEEDRATESGLKAACHKFQVAAGIFQHIRENVVKELVGTLTQDLIHDGLNAASTLMLAQAQACFYEKAVKDRSKKGLKPTIIAKLAAKAGEFYTQTLGFMQGPNLAPGLDKSWPAHVEFQSVAFSAAACYWESVAIHDDAEETGSGYGVEVAMLQKASELLAQAFLIAQRNSLSATFTNSAGTLQGMISKTLASRQKDNSTVYMQPVPGRHTLKGVPGAGMVKAVPFVGAPQGSASLFQGLLSKSAKAAVEDYKAKEAAAIAELDARAKEQSVVARSELAAVGLPGTVEAHESVGGVPESVWKKVQAVKLGGGGLAELEEKVSEVEASAERARSTIETVERTLDQDVRTDDSFRKRYAGEYEGMSTADLARDLRRDVEHFRGLWRTARSADEKVKGRIEDPANREGLELVEKTREGLDAAMPAGRGAGADGSGSEVQTAALSMKLVELASLLAERDAKLAALNDFVKNRDVAPELAMVGRNGGGSPEAYQAAVERALQALAPFRDDIEANIGRQGPMLAEILAENERFQKARASDQATLDREAFLQRVHASVTLFHEVHAQLSEGSTFYSDLLQRLAQLNQTCEDLVYTQGLHRREFEVGYTHRRERALREGEDASIELARQMAAQAQVAQGQQPGSAPPPASTAAPAAGIAGTPSAGYPSASASPPRPTYGQVPWSGFSRPPGQSQPSSYGQPQAPQPQYQPPSYEPSTQSYHQQPYQPPPQQHQHQHQNQNQQPPGAAPAVYYSQPPTQQQSHQYPYGGGLPAAQAPPPGAAVQAPPRGTPAPVPSPSTSTGGASQRRWGPWSLGQGTAGGQTRPLPPTPTPAGGDPNDPKFKRLVEMGFDPARVRSALAETKGDESAAVGKLLSQA